MSKADTINRLKGEMQKIEEESKQAGQDCLQAAIDENQSWITYSFLQKVPDLDFMRSPFDILLEITETEEMAWEDDIEGLDKDYFAEGLLNAAKKFLHTDFALSLTNTRTASA